MNPNATEKLIKNISFIVTTVIGLAVVFFALKPPEFLITLNLFAFGGLESAFLWTVVFGLYWKKANKYGSISSMIVGLVLYLYINHYHPNIWGMHSVTIPVVSSLIVFVVVSIVMNKVKKMEDYLY